MLISKLETISDKNQDSCQLLITLMKERRRKVEITLDIVNQALLDLKDH